MHQAYVLVEKDVVEVYVEEVAEKLLAFSDFLARASDAFLEFKFHFIRVLIRLFLFSLVICVS